MMAIMKLLKKNKTFFTQLKQVTRDINPLVKIADISYYDSELGFSILPYADLHREGSIEKFISTAPLFTHVRGEYLHTSSQRWT